MKPLTLEETRLKEEMKNNCLKVGKYKDENAKAKFKMLCHLEDFEVQYWELQKENQKLKKQVEQYQEEVCILDMRTDENIKYKNQQKEFIDYMENEININPYDISDYDYEDIINTILSKYKEIIGVSNEY